MAPSRLTIFQYHSLEDMASTLEPLHQMIEVWIYFNYAFALNICCPAIRWLPQRWALENKHFTPPMVVSSAKQKTSLTGILVQIRLSFLCRYRSTKRDTFMSRAWELYTRYFSVEIPIDCVLAYFIKFRVISKPSMTLYTSSLMYLLN